MNKSIRYLIVGATVLTLCALSVVGGYYAGNEHAVAKTAAIVTGGDMLALKTVLQQIESKNTAAAKESIYSLLDDHIVELYAYQADLADADIKKSSLTILSLIAKYRKDHPFNTNYSPGFDKKLKDILDRIHDEKP